MKVGAKTAKEKSHGEGSSRLSGADHWPIAIFKEHTDSEQADGKSHNLARASYDETPPNDYICRRCGNKGILL